MSNAFGVKPGSRVRVSLEADVKAIGRNKHGVYLDTGDNYIYADQKSLVKVDELSPPPPQNVVRVQDLAPGSIFSLYNTGSVRIVGPDGYAYTTQGVRQDPLMAYQDMYPTGSNTLIKEFKK